MGKIVWLASYPKSGNTWMRTFMHNLMRNPKEAYDINKTGGEPVYALLPGSDHYVVVTDELVVDINEGRYRY